MIFKIYFRWLVGILIVAVILALSINLWVVFRSRKLVEKSYQGLENYEAIVILGVSEKNKESNAMVLDRALVGATLFRKGVAPKIIVGGSGIVNILIQEGVAENNIFREQVASSTYDVIYRLKNIYKLKRIVIVAQEEYLYRALYIADSLGLEAVGVGATLHDYKGQVGWKLREILARNKDFWWSLGKMKPAYKN